LLKQKIAKRKHSNIILVLQDFTQLNTTKGAKCECGEIVSIIVVGIRSTIHPLQNMYVIVKYWQRRFMAKSEACVGRETRKNTFTTFLTTYDGRTSKWKGFLLFFFEEWA